jgi:hypothetical protein
MIILPRDQIYQINVIIFLFPGLSIPRGSTAHVTGRASKGIAIRAKYNHPACIIQLAHIAQRVANKYSVSALLTCARQLLP